MAALDLLIDPAHRVATPSHRCAGRARARGTWPAELTRQRPPDQPSDGSGVAGVRPAIALQANAKTPGGARATQTVTPNSDTSTAWCGGSSGATSRPISIDTKRRNWSEISRTAGREWLPQGRPQEVPGARLPGQDQGQSRSPTGVYDILNNQGWVSVGVDHDTRPVSARQQHPAAGGRRWAARGSRVPPGLLHHGRRGAAATATAAGCGRLALQQLANETGVAAECLPTSRRGPASGTRSNIGSSASSRRTGGGAPLVSHQAIVSLIAGTTTRHRLDRQKPPSTPNRYDTRRQGERRGAVAIEDSSPIPSTAIGIT